MIIKCHKKFSSSLYIGTLWPVGHLLHFVVSCLVVSALQLEYGKQHRPDFDPPGIKGRNISQAEGSLLECLQETIKRLRALFLGPNDYKKFRLSISKHSKGILDLLLSTVSLFSPPPPPLGSKLTETLKFKYQGLRGNNPKQMLGQYFPNNFQKKGNCSNSRWGGAGQNRSISILKLGLRFTLL